MPLTVRRRRRLLALATALVAGIACIPSASAAVGPPGAQTLAAHGFPTENQPYADCADTDGKPFATGLPALPCLPQGDDQPTRWQDFGAPFDDLDQSVARPKIALRLPLTLGRTFFVTCTQATTTSTNPCPTGYDIPIPKGSRYAGWFGVAAAVYLQSPLGDRQQYGDFAPVRTALLAFGSLPATATVTVAQQVVDGTVTPLQLSWASSDQVGKGVTYPAYRQFGPSPYELSQFYPEAHVRGPITITVSEVAVDGVPLDVGPSCHTSTDLDLTAPGGWIDSETYIPTRGEPGAYNPVAGPPSYLTAQVDIPAFTECRRGDEDVSALVTGLVSGRGNTLDVTQTQGLLPYACLPGFTDTCYGQHPVVIDPGTLPKVSAR